MQKVSINNDVAKNIWEEIGTWWDEQMLEGDIFHKYLIHPYMLEQLDLNANDVVIDLACGNGGLTRKIAKVLNKPIIGVDFSNSLLESAKKREVELSCQNHYYQTDLMDTNQLNKLIDLGRFNKAVCSMAIQDIENIEPLLATLKRALPAGGYFIISIPHPCFNSGEIKFQPEDNSIARHSYINPVQLLVHAKENQPQPHPHFHRSLSNLLNLFFNAGFVLDSCVEPIFQEETLASLDKDYLWAKIPGVPPVMILRFRA